MNANPRVRWTIVQRSYWANRATDFRDWLRIIAQFDLIGRSDNIRCPVLGTFADHDPLAGSAKDTLSRLKAPTTLLTFSSEQGAGGHQEMLNRALAADGLRASMAARPANGPSGVLDERHRHRWGEPRRH